MTIMPKFSQTSKSQIPKFEMTDKLYPAPPLVPTIIFVAIVASAQFFTHFVSFNYTLSKRYEHSLDVRESWLTPFLNGQLMDMRDPQWRSFRSSIPSLCGFFTLQAVLRRLLKDERGYVGALLTLVWIIVLHRIDALFMVFVVYVNYLLIVNERGNEARFSLWLFNLGILYLVRQYNNFLHQGYIDDGFLGEFSSSNSMVPWYYSYNLAVLRLLSFVEEAHNWKDKPTVGKPSFAVVLFYIYYPPLHLTGPTMCYDDFVIQLRDKSKRGITKETIIPYAARLLFAMLVFELFNSYFYATALTYEVRYGKLQLPLQTLEDVNHAIYWSFAALFAVWFKFLIIWRIARFFALLDQFNPPENMKRCVANNYTFRGFWRDWHCSFNAWLVRYIYIPLGGNKKGIVRQGLAIASVFIFVALWHDFELRLVVWGLGLSVALLPEIIATQWSYKSKYAIHLQANHPWKWDIFAAFGGAIAIVGLEFLNMIGYTLENATWTFVQKIESTPGSFFIVGQWFSFMWLGAVYMVRLRRREAELKNAHRKEEKGSDHE
jgi:D-alanyl-lipoteichoic acid acyltransferase DltB (MBOAT superfamily)